MLHGDKLEELSIKNGLDEFAMGKTRKIADDLKDYMVRVRENLGDQMSAALAQGVEGEALSELTKAAETLIYKAYLEGNATPLRIF